MEFVGARRSMSNMKITKLAHSCMIIEKSSKESSQVLIVDPGNYADYSTIEPFVGRAVGLIITHVHGDHFYRESVDKILAAKPDIKIYSTGQVAAVLPQAIAATAGQVVEVGDFTVAFFGGTHASMFNSVPDENIGILVDGKLSYPGDSFDVPPSTPEVAAIPIGGPWSNTSMAVEYLVKVAPTQFGFNIHDAHYNEAGFRSVEGFAHSMQKKYPEIAYRRIHDGESFDI
jgi:L-ascorbate metabolism protein UlaG (beta-lactamase superfamily)